MKEKKSFKIHEAKERPSRPKSVSQKKRTGLESQRLPEPGDPQDAKHNPNKIKTAKKDKRVSSTQSCSEESKSIKQTFMNKGAIPQGTKNEKTINRSGWKGTFNPTVKNSNYLGKMIGMEGSQKAENVKMAKQLRSSNLKGSGNGKSAKDFHPGRTKRKKL